MARQVDFTMKTRGWKMDSVTNNTSDTSGETGIIFQEADYYKFTLDGRLAIAERQQTDLTGIEINQEVCFPQGWSIQEASIPNGWLDPATSYAAEGAPTTRKTGLPLELECYDIWSTKMLRDEDIDEMVMAVGSSTNGYTQVFPGFLSIFDVGTLTRDPYWDQEQVICGRSRYWNVSLDVTRSNAEAQAAVRKLPMNLIHDLSWGMMEPMAISLLHHCRVWRMAVPVVMGVGTAVFQSADTEWFYTLPASNQPMLTLAEKPDFVSRMTMERRSRDV